MSVLPGEEYRVGTVATPFNDAPNVEVIVFIGPDHGPERDRLIHVTLSGRAPSDAQVAKARERQMWPVFGLNADEVEALIPLLYRAVALLRAVGSAQA